MVMLCSVSLMPPTAAVTVSLVVHRESGSFLMELWLVFFLLMLLVAVTPLQGIGDKVLYVYIDRTIHQKEDVSIVNCWGTPSMSTSVSGYFIQLYIAVHVTK